MLRVRDNRYNYKHFRLTFIRNAYYFCITYKCTVYIRYFSASKTNGFDCIVIPGASKTAGTDLAFDKQCGRSKGLITADGGSGKTVCSKYRQYILEFHFINNKEILEIWNTYRLPFHFSAKAQPFRLQFLSDQFEFVEGDMESKTAMVGLKLNYILSNENC